MHFPYLFLDGDVKIPLEARMNMVLVACQMIESEAIQGASEFLIQGEVLYAVHVATEFKNVPVFNGIIFRGLGGVKGEEGPILTPFKTRFLVNQSKIPKKRMSLSLHDPEEFLNDLMINYRMIYGHLMIAQI